MEMDCLKFYLFVLSVLFGFVFSLDVTRKTSYNDCLTWRDDKEWLQLICRVSDLVSPVVFFHNESKTEVTCQIINDVHNCTPQVNKFYFKRYTQTVTFELYEKKAGRYLDGEWYCKQGVSIQRTAVSLSEGIIKDPSIYMRGTLDNFKKLIVECSSCRIPKRRYVEISINGKTIASLRQSAEGCFYENTPCLNTSICNCSETHNSFSLLLSPNVSPLSNISCDMQFEDALRGITYYTTVSHEFKGKDFEETGKDITILSNPYLTATRFPTIETTAVIGLESSKPKVTTPNVETSWRNDNSKIGIAAAVPSAAALVLCCVIIIICYRSKKEQKKQKYLLTNTDEESDLRKYKENHAVYKAHERKTDEEKGLLQGYNFCQSCQKKANEDMETVFCFDCSGTFCLKCINAVHGQHNFIQISTIPSSYPVTLFKCHHNQRYRYYCENHNMLCCTKCENDHVNCETEEIESIREETIRSYYEKHMSLLGTFKERLELYHQWLLKGFYEFSRQTEKHPEIASIQKDKQDQYKKDKTHYDNEIIKTITKISSNEKWLELIDKTASKNHLFIILHNLKDDLVIIENKTDQFQNLLYRLEVSMRNKDVELVVKKIENNNRNKRLGKQCVITSKVPINEEKYNFPNIVNDQIITPSTCIPDVDENDEMNMATNTGSLVSKQDPYPHMTKPNICHQPSIHTHVNEVLPNEIIIHSVDKSVKDVDSDESPDIENEEYTASNADDISSMNIQQRNYNFKDLETVENQPLCPTCNTVEKINSERDDCENNASALDLNELINFFESFVKDMTVSPQTNTRFANADDTDEYCSISLKKV